MGERERMVETVMSGLGMMEGGILTTVSPLICACL